MVDFVERLTEQINLLLLSQNVHEQVLPERTKAMVIQAADEVLVAATKGQMKTLHLETREVAYIVASLMFDQPGFTPSVIKPKTK
jgi:hypothetical protein